MSIQEMVEKYVDLLSYGKDNVLRDRGDEVVFRGSDKEHIAAAMHDAHQIDAAYRANEDITIPSDPFAPGGAWHRAANKAIALHKIYGGDIAHRILMASVR